METEVLSKMRMVFVATWSRDPTLAQYHTRATCHALQRSDSDAGGPRRVPQGALKKAGPEAYLLLVVGEEAEEVEEVVPFELQAHGPAAPRRPAVAPYAHDQ
eukprot:2958803-Rhodomonas_salina.1